MDGCLCLGHSDGGANRLIRFLGRGAVVEAPLIGDASLSRSEDGGGVSLCARYVDLRHLTIGGQCVGGGAGKGEYLVGGGQLIDDGIQARRTTHHLSQREGGLLRALGTGGRDVGLNLGMIDGSAVLQYCHLDHASRSIGRYGGHTARHAGTIVEGEHSREVGKRLLRRTIVKRHHGLTGLCHQHDTLAVGTKLVVVVVGVNDKGTLGQVVVQGHRSLIVVPGAVAVGGSTLGALNLPLILPRIVHALGIIGTLIDTLVVLDIGIAGDAWQVVVGGVGMAVVVGIGAVREDNGRLVGLGTDIDPLHILRVDTVLTLGHLLMPYGAVGARFGRGVLHAAAHLIVGQTRAA